MSYNREIEILNGAEPTLDEIIDLLFTIVGNNEKSALKWMFGYNLAFKDSPINLVAQGKLKELYGYLHFNAYGPY